MKPERVAIKKWGTPGASVVAHTRAFNLEHLGTHVGEEHGRVGTRDRPGEIEHPNSLEQVEAVADIHYWKVDKWSCGHILVLDSRHAVSKFLRPVSIIFSKRHASFFRARSVLFARRSALRSETAAPNNEPV